MLPSLKTKTIQVDGIAEPLVIREMSGKAFVEMTDARALGKDKVEVAAIVAKYCVPAWSDHSVDEILDSVRPGALGVILVEVTTMLSEDDAEGKSEAGPVAVSS